MFALWQLDGNGCLQAAVGRRVRVGRLRRLHHGVYAYGHRRLTPSGHRLAAVLACGPGAVLSHRSAAALWELLATARTRIDVTVPGTSRRTRTGVHLHRTRELQPGDVAVIHGVPVTTVSRTLCDLAGAVSRARFQRAVEQAERSGILDLSALQRAVDRHPTRRGTASVRAVLDDYTPARLTRSELERRFRELLQAAGLPMPLTNHVVAGYEVDAYWPQWRLVVELDGRAYHSDPRAFERDPVRDARLMRAGCRVLRVTAKRLARSPKAVLADIRALAALAEGL
ncbi:MAG: DUF559 domain-containing protein [Solirubrobacteraceae bacterium]